MSWDAEMNYRVACGVLVLAHTSLLFSTSIACSRLRDGGGKSFSNKKCEKRAGAAAAFPKSCASYFRFARFNMFPLYYLRAWHRLVPRGIGD